MIALCAQCASRPSACPHTHASKCQDLYDLTVTLTTRAAMFKCSRLTLTAPCQIYITTRFGWAVLNYAACAICGRRLRKPSLLQESI